MAGDNYNTVIDVLNVTSYNYNTVIDVMLMY